MSRIATSVASFSSQRAAIRRACSSDVRSVASWSVLHVTPESVYRDSRMISAVQAQPLDLGCHRRRNQSSIGELPPRPAGGSPTTRRASGVIGKSSTRSGWESRDDARPARSGRRRDGSRRRGAPARARAPDASRSGRRRTRRRRSGRAGRRGRAPRASRPFARTGRARPPPRRIGRERELGERQPRGGAVSTSLCPGSATTRTSSRSSPKCSIASRASANGRCAVGRRRRRGSRRRLTPRTTSSPISTSAPGFTPAARSASSSSSPSGGVPTTRKPWPVRRTRKRRPRGGCGRYSRNSGSSGRGRLLELLQRRTEPKSAGLELVDPLARRARDALDGDDPLVLDPERASAPGRSDLFSTTSCGRSPRPAP